MTFRLWLGVAGAGRLPQPVGSEQRSREAVEAYAVLFLTVLREPFGAFVRGPFVVMVAFAEIFVERDREAAGGLHLIDSRRDDLPGRGMDVGEEGDEVGPLLVGRQDGAAVAV